jgi:hypothetical protein
MICGKYAARNSVGISSAVDHGFFPDPKQKRARLASAASDYSKVA